MASGPMSKGTRKTYSFEEREILVNLIYKHLSCAAGEEEDKGPPEQPAGAPKRKSVWSRLTEEYNGLVGPENARSSIQLRRCWENMKANKRHRDDKRLTDKPAAHELLQQQQQQLPPPSALGLPPNVVFHPKDAESFAFEGLLTPSFRAEDVKREDEANEDEDHEFLEELPCDPRLEPPAKRPKRKSASPKKTGKQGAGKPSKLQRSNELYEFTLSEAQLKLEVAALMKEEAKLKLEEAEYRKEEARMRMICANYELQKLREDAMEEDENRRETSVLR